MKPILFNTEMVRAILDGRKTATRRIIKYSCPSSPESTLDDFVGESDPQLLTSCAPYRVGDVLYVRETWAALPVTPGGHMRGHDVYYYKADGDLRPEAWRGNWKPSIHMPKEAARLFLRVTDVWAERLQDITEEQAEKEGCTGVACNHINADEHGCWDCLNTGFTEPPTIEFLQVWNSTIKKSDLPLYGWDANPWVFVIEFERCEKP